MKFGRYMVFVSNEYDNSSPFDHIELSTDNIDEALGYCRTASIDNFLSQVFDRVDGVLILEIENDRC